MCLINKHSGFQEGGPPPFVGFGKQRTMSSGQVDTSRPAFPMAGADVAGAGGRREDVVGGRRASGSVDEKDQTTSTFEQLRDEALQVWLTIHFRR